MKLKERDSNYELLRIVATFLIVLWHTILHADLLSHTTGVLKFVFDFLICLSIIHVSLYMLIMGYYQSKQTFKLKKVISLIVQIWFYNFIINFILAVFGIVEYTNIEFLKQTFIFNYECYWFMGCYIITYLFSPFLNKLINCCNRVELKKITLLCIICFSFFPYFTGNLGFWISGFNLYQFITMYFIGAYIRKYNIDKELFYRLNINQKRLIYIITFCLLLFFNFSLYYLANYMGTLNSNILSYISHNIQKYFLEYNSPFVIFEAIVIFLLFGTFNIKSKIINKISSLTLGIYLIHENCYMQKIIYDILGLRVEYMISSKLFLLKVIICVIIIFVVCALIEFFRKKIFDLALKNKYISRFCDKFYDFLNRLIEIKQ